MIHGIAPLVEGNRDKRLALATWSLHVLGGSVGGMMVGATLWVALAPLRSWTPLPVRAALLVVLIITGLADPLSRGRVRLLPSRQIQVPQAWYKRYGPPSAYFRYGLVLGSGIWTYIPNALVYVAFGGASLLLSFGGAVVAGSAFGVGRTLVVGPAATVTRLVAILPARLGTLSRWSTTASLILSAVLAVMIVVELSAVL
jgi:hypothetical protein